MNMLEMGCWSDALFLMENRGFSKEEATELALQLFNWGMKCAFDRMRPSRPLPADLPPEVHAAAEFTLTAETVLPPSPAKPAKPRREPKKAPHRFPADFVLSDELLAFARERGFTAVEIDSMWAKFSNHHKANGSEFVDWNAAWRTWVMRSVDYKNRDNRGPGGGDRNRIDDRL
jgi:hypothetical protein